MLAQGTLISMGTEDGFVESHALQHALDGPHSMWHGHGRMISILVFAHLVAFLYWCATQTTVGVHQLQEKGIGMCTWLSSLSGHHRIEKCAWHVVLNLANASVAQPVWP